MQYNNENQNASASNHRRNNIEENIEDDDYVENEI
jgi:hypothetical protein